MGEVLGEVVRTCSGGFAGGGQMLWKVLMTCLKADNVSKVISNSYNLLTHNPMTQLKKHTKNKFEVFWPRFSSLDLKIRLYR